MLVANLGQTTSYVLHSKKPCHPTSNNTASTSGSVAGTVHSSSTKSATISACLGTKSSRHSLASNCVGSTSYTTVTKSLPQKLAPPSADTSAKKQSNVISSRSNTSNTNSTVITTTTITTTGSSNSGSNSNNSATANTSSALMKSLAVRLNRGTEFLKETVQKALISKIPSHLSSVLNLNLYTVPPTATHRFSAERLNANSADSLKTEMCHFMPIRTAPTTPWKSNSKSRGASLKMPKACLAKNVNTNCCDAVGVTGQSTLGAEGHMQFRPKANSTLLTTIFTTPERQSAFVCLVANMKTIAKSPLNSNVKEVNQEKRGRPKRTQSKANILQRKKSVAAIAKRKSETAPRKRRSPPIKVNTTQAESIGIRRSARNLRTKSASNTGAGRSPQSVAKPKSTASIPKPKRGVNRNNNRRNLKRKLPVASEVNAVAGEEKAEVSRPTLRKSARLSKDGMDKATPSQISSTARGSKRLSRRQSKLLQKKRSLTVFSPPLTRSRLKRMSEMNLKSELVSNDCN